MDSARCWACNRPFKFDATKVPRVNGSPLCGRCIARVNELLREAGQIEVIVEEGTYPDE